MLLNLTDKVWWFTAGSGLFSKWGSHNFSFCIKQWGHNAETKLFFSLQICLHGAIEKRQNQVQSSTELVKRIHFLVRQQHTTWSQESNTWSGLIASKHPGVVTKSESRPQFNWFSWPKLLFTHDPHAIWERNVVVLRDTMAEGMN